MSLRPFALLKHILYAALLLVFTVSATEVGLRVYMLRSACLPGTAAVDQLTSPCWQSHHQLKPLQAITTQQPDTGETVALKTNSFGLRGPEIAVPKPPGVYRIVCLGDEHILALGSQQSQTLCERLRESLQLRTQFSVEVVNAGVPGYCPLLSYLQVKHSLLALQPDLLILNLDMSDIADDQKYRRSTQIDAAGIPLACPHAALESQAPTLAQKIDDQFLTVRWCKSLLERLPLHADGDAADIHAISGRYAWLADNPPDWELYTAQALSPIEQLRAACDATYVSFVVATYPAPWQVAPHASSGPGVRKQAGIADDAVFKNRAPFEAVARYLEKRAIPFCDASPAFTNTPHPEILYLNNAPEFSAEGHALYANELAAFLVRSISGVWSRDSEGSPPATPLPRMTTRDGSGGRL